jgi:MFS family permease
VSTSNVAGAGDRASRLPRAERANPFAWRFTTPLFMGSALNPINSSVIATALVPIARALHVSVGGTAVLVSSLYVASAIAQPTAGKLSEELGPRRVFIAGILLVLIGGVVGGVGQGLSTLVVARVLIGIGTSAGYPSAMVLIRRRAKSAAMGGPPGNVLGGLAIAGMATIAVGPAIGGLLVGGIGWRSAFLINMPFGLTALAMATFWIPRDPPVPSGMSARGLAARIDVAGIIGFGGAMIALLVFLMSLPHPHWIALVVAVVLAVSLVGWELRAATPFFDVRLLSSNLALTRTYLRSALTLFGMYVIFYGLTQWVEAARGFSAEQAGLLLLPMGALAAILSRPISARNLVRGPLIAAPISMLIGSIGVLLLTTRSSSIAIVGVGLVFGISMATTAVGNQTALYKQAPANVVGTASGLLRTFGYVGSIAAATITGIAFRTRVNDSGLHAMAWILIAAGAVVLAMTVLDGQLSSREHPGRPPEPALAYPNIDQENL